MDGIDKRSRSVIYGIVFISMLCAGFTHLLIGIYHRILKTRVHQIFLIGTMY